MEIKQRHMEFSEETKRNLQKQRSSITACRYDSDALYKTKYKKQMIDFIQKEQSCCLYGVAQKTDVDLIYAPMRPFCTQSYWSEGTYYTKGTKIVSFSEQLSKECIAVINEIDKIYRGTTPDKMHYTGINCHPKSFIYLYSNGNLYLMDSSEHPDAPKESYSFSEELCKNESHINIVNKEIERLLSQQETNVIALTKKLHC